MGDCEPPFNTPKCPIAMLNMGDIVRNLKPSARIGWEGWGAYQVSEPVSFASVLGPHQLLKPVRCGAEVGTGCLSYLEDTMAVHELRTTHTKTESKGNNPP